MAWSLDWFAAEKLAKAGAMIRRAGWTDRVLTRQGAIWLLTITANPARVVNATDFLAADLNARDWTDQPFNANPCSATPAFNTSPPAYGQWTDQPVQLPPPVPGYAS
jgi:hypothetical protein